MSLLLIFPASATDNFFQRNKCPGSLLLVLHLPVLLLSVLLVVVPNGLKRDPFCLALPPAATENLQPWLLTVFPSECSLQDKEHHSTLGMSDLEVEVVSALCQVPRLHVASTPSSLRRTSGSSLSVSA